MLERIVKCSKCIAEVIGVDQSRLENVGEYRERELIWFVTIF